MKIKEYTSKYTDDEDVYSIIERKFHHLSYYVYSKSCPYIDLLIDHTISVVSSIPHSTEILGSDIELSVKIGYVILLCAIAVLIRKFIFNIIYFPIKLTLNIVGSFLHVIFTLIAFSVYPIYYIIMLSINIAAFVIWVLSFGFLGKYKESTTTKNLTFNPSSSPSSSSSSSSKLSSPMVSKQPAKQGVQDALQYLDKVSFFSSLFYHHFIFHIFFVNLRYQLL